MTEAIATLLEAKPYWFEQEGTALAKDIESIADELEREQSARRARALTCRSLYEGKALTALGAAGYYQNGKVGEQLNKIDDLTINLHRSACHTVQAELAGRQKPKPQFMTSGADWQTRRKAKKLDKFVEAQLHQRQGRYLNAWALMEDAFLTCTIEEASAVYVYADLAAEKICFEPIPTYQLHVDPCEGQDPQSMFRVYPMDASKAVRLFCQVEGDEEGNARRKRAIQSAPEFRPAGERSGAYKPRVIKQVKVVEAWHLPFGEDEPGLHAIEIGGELMEESDWERPAFPFVFQRWAWQRDGYWGTSLIEEGETQVRSLNQDAQRLQERMRLCASKRTFYRPNSVNTEDLQANDAEVLIPVEEGHEYPLETVPQPFNPAELQWLQFEISTYYDTQGVSQMSASSRKEPGVDSGAAMRTLNDIKSVRFMPRAKMYENAFVDLAYQVLWTAQEVANEVPDFAVRWPGKSFLREMKWTEVADVVREELYTATVAPASALPMDPAGRLQMAQELYSSKLVDGTTFKNLLQWPDLEKELGTENAEYEYIEDLIDRYLDADPKEWDSMGDFESPEGYIIDKQRALLQVSAAYFQAKQQRAPEFNQKLLQRYIRELDAEIQKAAQAQAAMQAPPQPMAGPGPAMAA